MENIDACVCMRKGNKTKKKKKRREDTFASFTVVRMVWRRWMWRAYRKYGARKINSFYASVARDWCVARNIILSDSWFVYTIYALLTQPDSTQALQIIPFYLNTNDCWPNRTSMCDERWYDCHVEKKTMLSHQQKHHMFTLHTIIENENHLVIRHLDRLWNMPFIYGIIFVMINKWIERRHDWV